MTKTTKVVTDCVWRRLDRSGHDAFRLERSGDEWRLIGTAIGMEETSSYAIEYEVLCDPGWNVVEGHAKGWFKGNKFDLSLARVDGGRWLADGHELKHLFGCPDLDFGFTPATNTVALRRLDLAIGKEGRSTAAWLPFPKLKMDRLDQLYKRIADQTYEYRVPEIEFECVLTVDQDQVIVEYPGLWTRVG